MPCLKWRSYGGGAPGLLKTSTAMGAEALQALLTTATFHLIAGMDEAWSNLTTSETSITELMMNVELDHLAYSPDVLISGLLGLFEGAKVLRNSAIIDLETYRWQENSEDENRLGCFEPLKDFIGFRSVIVRITPKHFVIPDEEEEFREVSPSEAGNAAQGIASYLELSLGPSSVISDWWAPSTPTSYLTGTREVEFRPRNHLNKLTQMGRKDMDVTTS